MSLIFRILTGYCFLDFGNAFAAHKFLHQLNGTVIPGTNKTFKLNWASGGTTAVVGTFVPLSFFVHNLFVFRSEYAVYIGDLGSEVNDYMLYQLFSSRYQSIRNARVVTDPGSGQSKNYGFVRFGDEAESFRAISELNGFVLGSRGIRLSTANTKSNGVTVQSQSRQPSQPQVNQNDESNTTIFIGGIDSNVSEEELKSYFATFGDIHTIKIPAGKGYGFISYYGHQNAEIAIQRMNGSIVGILYL